MEDDDVIDLHGNHSPMRMVDAIELKLCGHGEDAYGRKCSKFGSELKHAKKQAIKE